MVLQLKKIQVEKKKNPRKINDRKSIFFSFADSNYASNTRYT